jgi:nitrous oxide reductase
MRKVSRRRFLLQSGAAVGAAGVLTTTSALTGANDAEASQPAAPPAESTEGPVVAHLRDVRSGQVDLYVGTRQVSVQDRQLAARLVRALG